jgi:hypothetical protein
MEILRVSPASEFHTAWIHGRHGLMRHRGPAGFCLPASLQDVLQRRLHLVTGAKNARLGVMAPKRLPTESPANEAAGAWLAVCGVAAAAARSLEALIFPILGCVIPLTGPIVSLWHKPATDPRGRQPREEGQMSFLGDAFDDVKSVASGAASDAAAVGSAVVGAVSSGATAVANGVSDVVNGAEQAASNVGNGVARSAVWCWTRPYRLGR